MKPENEILKKLASQKITKGKLSALQKASNEASALFERLYPKAEDEDSMADFESECEDLQSALEELESAISDLEMAEDKDEREDAVAMIEDALEQVSTGFEALMADAVVRDKPRSKPTPTASEIPDEEILQQVRALLKLAPEKRASALEAWVRSGVTAEQIQERQKKVDNVFTYMAAAKQAASPPAP